MNIQVRVSKRLRADLVTEADENEMTLSEFVRYVLREYINNRPTEEDE